MWLFKVHVVSHGWLSLTHNTVDTGRGGTAPLVKDVKRDRKPPGGRGQTGQTQWRNVSKVWSFQSEMKGKVRWPHTPCLWAQSCSQQAHLTQSSFLRQRRCISMIVATDEGSCVDYGLQCFHHGLLGGHTVTCMSWRTTHTHTHQIVFGGNEAHNAPVHRHRWGTFFPFHFLTFHWKSIW